MIKPITIFAIMGLLIACSARHVDRDKPSFDTTCSRLDLSATVISQLYEFKTTKSEDRAQHAKAVYNFLLMHQLWRGNKGKSAAAVRLTDSDINTLLGPYDETDNDGNWIYFFNANKSASFRLEFKDGYLALTGYEFHK
jgi:hypothetical protein